MKDNFLMNLLRNRPELSNRYNSEQYKMSKEILFWKHKNEFTNTDMADLLNLSKKEYLEFEGGYTEHSIEEYEKIMIKLRLQDYKASYKEKQSHNSLFDLNLKVLEMTTKEILMQQRFSRTVNKLVNVEPQNVTNPRKERYHFNSEKGVESNLSYSSSQGSSNRNVVSLREEYDFVYQ